MKTSRATGTADRAKRIQPRTRGSTALASTRVVGAGRLLRVGVVVRCGLVRAGDVRVERLARLPVVWNVSRLVLAQRVLSEQRRRDSSARCLLKLQHDLDGRRPLHVAGEDPLNVEPIDAVLLAEPRDGLINLAQDSVELARPFKSLSEYLSPRGTSTHRSFMGYNFVRVKSDVQWSGLVARPLHVQKCT